MRYRTAWALRAVAKLFGELADALDPPKAMLFGTTRTRTHEWPVANVTRGERVIPTSRTGEDARRDPTIMARTCRHCAGVYWGTVKCPHHVLGVEYCEPVVVQGDAMPRIEAMAWWLRNMPEHSDPRDHLT